MSQNTAARQTVLAGLFPEAIDNTYRGQAAGYWLLVLSVALKLVIGFNSMVWPSRIASAADAIPLGQYPPAAAAAVVSMFSGAGLSLLVLGLAGALALLRYRAMIPLVYLAFLIDQLGTKILLQIHPIGRGPASPMGMILNLSLLGVVALGFVLSLTPGRPGARSTTVTP